MKLSDMDRAFIASRVVSNGLKGKKIVSCGNGLARHQFLELLVRLSEQKYVRSGKANTISEALDRFCENIAEACEERARLQATFFDFLSIPEIDEIYHANLGLLQDVYNSFAGMTEKSRFMSLGEWENLLDKAGAYDESFDRRRAGVAFRMGLETCSDELFSTRFREMSFVEFLHGIAAVVFLRAGCNKETMPARLEAFFNLNLRSF